MESVECENANLWTPGAEELECQTWRVGKISTVKEEATPNLAFQLPPLIKA